MTKCYKISIVSIIFLLFFSISLFSQLPNGQNEYRLGAVNPRFTPVDTITSDAGRGVWVAANPDLDGDGKPEILVTEYTKGGRVFVYEVVGDDKLEFIWASPHLSETLSGGGSTPRMVTTGDFDNNGRQEIIFPVGFNAADSFEYANRGIYFYEYTGTDNDFGTEPAYKLTYEAIDSAFSTISTGRTEDGILVRDIDGDGRSELLYPPRAFDFSVAKLYILQVTSGTFSGGDAIIEKEYVYTDMVQVPSLGLDGYVPAGTEIGDVDNDGLDEIIVAGWQNIGAGAGVGFIQIDGPDSYTPGSIVRLADFSAFVVKAKPIFANVNGAPVIFLQGTNSGTLASQMWVITGIISDLIVTTDNVYNLFPNLGYWSAWAMGDQDHPTAGPGDGLDLYLYSGGGQFVDIEYDNVNSVTDTNSYTVTPVYDLSRFYSNLDGLFNDIYTYPGMDLDNDGLRDLVASYKGSETDSLGSHSLAKNGFHVFFFEWGDSTTSISLDSAYVGIKAKEFSIITPDDYRLGQNYPNPFNPNTNIEFYLPLKKTISLKIYNTLGQEIRTLINNREYLEGFHHVQWDGRDNHGNPVASGIYIYKLVFGNFSQSKKMTLIR